MNRPQVVGSFKKSDDVPPWIIDVEPGLNSLIRPTVRFAVDCHVIEVGDRYVLIPDANFDIKSYVLVVGARASGGNIFAASKTVEMPLRVMTMSAKP